MDAPMFVNSLRCLKGSTLSQNISDVLHKEAFLECKHKFRHHEESRNQCILVKFIEVLDASLPWKTHGD